MTFSLEKYMKNLWEENHERDIPEKDFNWQNWTADNDKERRRRGPQGEGVNV